jgi:hypothetical protein
MRILSQDVIRHHPCRLFHKANSLTQADLYELEWEGVRAVLKDYGGLLRSRRRLLGRLIGYFSVRRESRALERLEGLNAHPSLIGRVGGSAFLYERVDGDILPDHNEKRVSPEIFEQLTEAVKAMHDRGVAHGDLRRNNIYLGPDGTLRILDYETAVLDNGRPRSLRGRGFHLACKIDRIKIAKMKRRWLPEAPLSPEEEKLLKGEPVFFRLARGLRQNLYRRFVKRIRRLIG